MKKLLINQLRQEGRGVGKVLKGWIKIWEIVIFQTNQFHSIN